MLTSTGSLGSTELQPTTSARGARVRMSERAITISFDEKSRGVAVETRLGLSRPSYNEPGESINEI